MDDPVVYEIALDSRIKKFLKTRPQKHTEQILRKIAEFKTNPRPQDHLKMKNDPRAGYRVTVGEYRILYDIDDEAKLIEVRVVIKRNDGYKP